MEVGPTVLTPEVFPQPDLLEIFAEQEVTIFGLTGTLKGLAEMCPVDLSDYSVPLEAKNEFVAKAINEAGLEISHEYEGLVTSIIEKHGLEKKFSVAKDNQDNHEVTAAENNKREAAKEVEQTPRPNDLKRDVRKEVVQDTQQQLPQDQQHLRQLNEQADRPYPSTESLSVTAEHYIATDTISNQSRTKKTGAEAVGATSKERPETGFRLTQLKDSPLSIEVEETLIQPDIKLNVAGTDVAETVLSIDRQEAAFNLSTDLSDKTDDYSYELEAETADDYATNEIDSQADSEEMKVGTDQLEEPSVQAWFDELERAWAASIEEAEEANQLVAFEAIPTKENEAGEEQIAFNPSEIPAPLTQIEDALDAIAEALKAEEGIQDSPVDLILKEIMSLPEITEHAGENISVDEKLEELFIKLFESIEIEYTPELLTTFVNLTKSHCFENLFISTTSEEILDLPDEIGTREFLQKLYQGLNSMKKASLYLYQIGKSVLQLYSLRSVPAAAT